jgi:GNAT superfamily N-acetyltransferase
MPSDAHLTSNAPFHDTAALAAEIEPLAVKAWPAREITPLDGWAMRFTSGSSHRGNSVVTLDYRGAALAASIDAVEREYGRRGLVPMFHLTLASRPEGLEAELLARRYRRVSPTHLYIALTESLLARLAPPRDVERCSLDDPRFRALVTEGSRSAVDAAERLEILARLTTPSFCALALAGTAPVACGVGVETSGWVSFYVMRSHAAARRQGHAKRVLAAIADWARQRQAERLFLQVEDHNEPARALYRAAGFEPAYPYKYYILERPPA